MRATAELEAKVMSPRYLRPRFTIFDYLKFTAVCALMLGLSHAGGAGIGGDLGLSLIVPLAVAVTISLTAVRPKVAAPRCVACGGERPPAPFNGASELCPTCRYKQLPPDERRPLLLRNGLIILGLMAMLAAVLSVAVYDVAHSQLGWSWFVFPALSIGLFLFLLVASFAAIVVQRVWVFLRYRRPAFAVAMAQSCGGNVVSETKMGPVTISVFGTKDQRPMIIEQMESARKRFEALVGEPVELERALYVFAFETRATFERFVRPWGSSIANVDGMYLPWPGRSIAFSSEVLRYRLTDLDRMLRLLFTYYYLENFKRGPIPFWIQAGIANAVASGGDDGELARLNCKMMASLARGDSLQPHELFRVPPAVLLKLMRSWEHHASFARYTHLVSQAWSLTEYLSGKHAPPERRERFRAFLMELNPKNASEDLFEQHFGYRYEALDQDWRAWVASRGIGAYEAAPVRTRALLVNRVIPIIQDHQSPVVQRIQAIRDLGRTGCVVGADCLIELLKNGDPIPAEEVIWSLEAISGEALGRDIEAWQRWWDRLPAESTCPVTDFATEGASGGLSAWELGEF